MPNLLSAALRIAAKDLRVCLRDRQTVIYAVVLPLAMYPVLFWVLLQAQALIAGKRSAQTLTVAVLVEDARADGDGPADRAERSIAALGLDADGELFEVWGRRSIDGGAEATARELLTGEDPPDVVLAVLSEQTGVSAHSESSDGAEASRPGPDPPLAVFYDGARARSTNGLARLTEHLDRTAEAARDGALAERELSRADLAALEYRGVDLAEAEDLGAFAVSLMLPMMIVIMAVMGAFYPAIDLTAGERERGTEETTLLLPVPRAAVQIGKILTVTAIGGLASSVNLLGMGLAAGHLLGMLGDGAIDFRLSPLSLVLVAPFVLVFVLFVSSILTAVASFAETFKQGQSLMGTAQLVFIFPAMATSLPGLTLTPSIAAIPVVGAAVAFRTILRGGPVADLPWGGLAIAALAMLAYAALAVAVSVRLLNQELRTGGQVSVLSRLTRALGLASAR